MEKKTFMISYSEVTHYETTPIIAIDKDEADEIFRNMLDAGLVEVNETEMEHYNIEEAE